MKITIESIKHGVCRNDSVGDYGGSWSNLWIKVTKMRDWRMTVCIMVHELVEVAICRHLGVSNRTITAFDKAYEAKRPYGSTKEPGDDPAAPYVTAHKTATRIERILAKALDLDWKKYEETINSL